MRYVSMRGKFGSNPVNRICNPSVLSAPELASANYENLMASNKGLLFTGHIMKTHKFSKERVIFLDDERPAYCAPGLRLSKGRLRDRLLKRK